MSLQFDSLLCSALDDIAIALERHRLGEKAPLSVSVLMQVQEELESMRRTMNPSAFKPGYPRFVLDWPDDTGLVSKLIKVAYIYGKLKGVRGG